MGKIFQYYYLKDICQGLGKNKCQVQNFCHVFTGCDRTLQFLGKGEKIIVGCLDSISSATVAFNYTFQDPFMKVNKNSMCFELLMGLHVFFRKRQHQSQV